jgi:HD superfamily phosphodiesterase
MDTKISDTQMEETIIHPATEEKIVHDYDDLLKRRAEAQAQADMYLGVVKDFDALLARMDAVGVKASLVAPR